MGGRVKVSILCTRTLLLARIFTQRGAQVLCVVFFTHHDPKDSSMSRQLFEGPVHDAIQAKHDHPHQEVVGEVQQAVTQHDVVIVGMAQNPFCKRARKAAEGTGKPFTYLEYGSYLSKWKPRLALKMWSGWGTFPQVFVKGTLVGGATDLEALIASGEFERMVSDSST